MNIAYFNGKLLPKDEIKVSPDDRGFLFGDGIYEVIKWYAGDFYDLESHLARLKRSLKEVRINWPEADTFPSFATDLVKANHLSGRMAMIYIQVTRGEAPRSHAFPKPEVNPTVYAFIKELKDTAREHGSGVKVMLKNDIRWSRCDIKSTALLANILSFQEAAEHGAHECIFVRNGIVTEGAHSNIFFVINGILITHPESEHILAGVTRKNIIRIAKEAGIQVTEEPLPEKNLRLVKESFITSTTLEVTPVIAMDTHITGDGVPGPVTKLISEKFNAETGALKL